MEKTFLYIGFQIVLYLMWMICFSILFPSRFRLRLSLPLMVLAFLTFAFVTEALPEQSMTRAFLGAMLVIGIPQLLFEGKWYKKLIFTVAVLLVMALSEILAFVFLPPELSAQTVMSAPFSTLLAVYLIDFFGNFVLLGILTLLVRSFQQRYAGLVRTWQWLLLLLFPISQYVLLSGWFSPENVSANFRNSGYLALCILLCVAADLALVVLLRHTARMAELRTRTELLEEQIDSQQGYYQDLTQTYEDLRRMRHDIANHLFTVKILLEQGRAEEAGAYAEELRRARDAEPRIANCANPVVDSFLSRRREELAGEGIGLELSLSVPLELGIANSDVICALGNLLDNAAEACRRTEEKTILLSARYAAPYLRIETSNPCPVHPEKKPRRIPELERGLGFAVLRHLAERYDGAFSHSTEEGVFHASLTLRSET